MRSLNNFKSVRNEFKDIYKNIPESDTVLRLKALWHITNTLELEKKYKNDLEIPARIVITREILTTADQEQEIENEND